MTVMWQPTSETREPCAGVYVQVYAYVYIPDVGFKALFIFLF